MRIATLKLEGQERSAIVTERGLVFIETINRAFNVNWNDRLYDLLLNDQLDELNRWYQTGGKNRLEELPLIPDKDAAYAPLYRYPRKIIGVGFNYVENPSQLASIPENEEPVSFMKPDTSLIGPLDSICIPAQSEKTTAEAELAIIIGKCCKEVPESEAPDVVAGFTTALDMTAADIHQRNPRFLTRSKSFDTFFSFGPHFVTKDELPHLPDLEVSTILNGEVHKSNVVSNMIYRPWFIVSFFSQVMTLLPGDVILTGTPGAAVIRDGDVVECRIEGFEPLVNPVKNSLSSRRT
ncbi:fumarylacetoacetate hydrolase [Cohnella sp. CFH 77786]|uniref:fumarylacetoacetate hydrolase family protein n=1 Tax=Cohnella sp. CFH 77786 TaxID=2662265 RepID=UPI001C60CC26|nr:fumarylacetoacetate hydrolase family protein [Cohnella sp. CFH 77786]MBW5448913.1 fumarylacetoacetate hydrolase [Cohnella sp. CFH 77786]